MNQDQPAAPSPLRLSLGPVLFNWAPEAWRDFYFAMADCPEIDIVYLGEVVCAKRAPFFAPHLAEVTERLMAAGKEVVFSTLALVMNKQERQMVRSVAADTDLPVEANDVSALTYLKNRSHVIGPFLNLYNEETLRFFADRGAHRVCPPPELPEEALAVLADTCRAHGVEMEVLVYGRMPLALSARCYHARTHKLPKDACRFVCSEDPDGLDLRTLDEEPFLAVNGIQTLSYRRLALIQEIPRLQALGVSVFRLSPHSADMTQVARLFRAVLDGRLAMDEAVLKLEATQPALPLTNGYFHDQPGAQWVRLS